MTGYTVHTGASKKFVSGWDRVFGTSRKAGTKATAPADGGTAKTSGSKKAGKGRKKSS
ncbi:MAG: hypothetical protein ACKPJJ_33965 [Planctomycetaceae bacterium]|jgi:hypothetical protein